VSLGSDSVTLKGRGSGYLGQVGLNLALGVGGLSDAVGEGNVHCVELVPHLVGRHHQQVFDVARSLAKAARSLWDRRMLLSVSLAHDAGTEILWRRKERPPVRPFC